MKKSIYLFCLMLLVSACTKSGFSPEPDPGPGPGPKPPKPEAIEPAFWEGKLTELPPAASQHGSDEYSVLGYGFDITGSYCDPTDVRAQVLDLAAYAAARPDDDIITAFRINSSESGYGPRGRDTREFCQGLAAFAGLGMGEGYKGPFQTFGRFDPFKETLLKLQLPQKDFDQGKYVVSMNQTRILGTKVTFFPRFSDKKRFFEFTTEAFRQDIAQAGDNFDRVIERYGTHIYTQIYLGATFTVLYAFEKIQGQTYDSDELFVVESYMSRRMAEVFSIFGGALPNPGEKFDRSRYEKLYYETVGGQEGSNVRGIVEAGRNSNPVVDLSAWKKSLNEWDQQVLVKTNYESAIPIYELVEEGPAKEALKAAVRDYIKVHSW